MELDLSRKADRIALHEAGHAVVGWQLGRELTEIFIAPENEPDGVAGGTSHKRPSVPPRSPLEHSRAVMVDIAIMLSGAAILAKEGYPEPAEGAVNDLYNAYMHTLYAGAGAGEMAQAKVYAILNKPGVLEAARRLARALLDRRRLNGSEAEAILRGGRP